MTISLKHTFQSAKSDGTDSTLVQPSNWNAEHTITLAAGKVLGRDSTSAGAVQELPLSFDASGNASFGMTGYLGIAVGTTAQRPGTPVTGMFRYNSTLGKPEIYNGTAWGPVGGGGATISDTAPASPTAGDLWWKSDDGQMYVYYTDANSSQWVVANAYAGGNAYLPLAGGTLTGTLNGVNASFSGTISGTINGSNLVATSVAVAKLNATGTPGATNFLRGDGTWSAPVAGLSNISIASYSSVTNSSGTSLVWNSNGSSTWTVPAGVTVAKVTVMAAGGAGGGATGSSRGAGGRSGGVAIKYITGLTPGSTVSITVGAGGVAVSNAAGGSGGASSFGAYCSATGGTGGAANQSTSALIAQLSGGVGSSGDINITGPATLPDVPSSAGYGTACSGYVNSVYLIFGYGQAGANAYGSLGTGGFIKQATGAGNAASGFGAGGSGGTSPGTAVAGGNGTPGVVMIEF